MGWIWWGGSRLVIGVVVVMLAAELSRAALPASHASARTLDPTDAIYWGAYIDGVPWDAAKLAAFEATAGKAVSIIHWGQAWRSGADYQPFFANDFQIVRDHGAIPMLDWGAWDFAFGSEQPDFRLAEIAGGRHDAFVRAWASAARDWGHPFFLRFNWEMNGYWLYPWSERLNGNQPGDYVRAWRHVHDIFSDVGADNVSWVWCPNVALPDTTPIDSLYPGDDYVDWTCMDGYNWGLDRNSTWQTFSEVFQHTYTELTILAPDKPIMIGEISSSEDGGSKAEWVREALGTALPRHFPRVRALVWFNWNGGDPDLEWPIDSSPEAAQAFREVIADDYYAANVFGGLDVSPIPASPSGDGLPGMAPLLQALRQVWAVILRML